MTDNARPIQEVLGALRDEIRRIEQKPPQQPSFVSSGRPEIDALLPAGGFPRGALTDLAGGPASGKTALVLSALAAAMGHDGLAAFVDGRGELYPPAALALGVDLDRLLVVRSPSRRPARAGDGARDALWAAEALLASGAFVAVAIDVPLDSHATAPRMDAIFRRLRAAAERGAAVGLWLGSAEGARVPAAIRLELSVEAAGLRVRRAFAGGAGGASRTEWREADLRRALGACHAA